MVVSSVADASGASQGRVERAREIAEAGAVSRRSLPRDEWTVASQHGEGGYIVVRAGGKYGCQCPDFEHRGADARGFECKHILAVRLFEDGMMGEDEARELARGLAAWTGFSPDAAAAMFALMPRSLAIRLVRETRRVQTEAAYWGGAR